MTFPQEMDDVGRAFVRHWQDLRGVADAIPAAQVFLDRPAPRFQPHLAFHDQDAAGRSVIRLFGTALVTAWGTDLTGRALDEMFPAAIAERFRQTHTRCVSWPCGIWESGRYTTSAGRIAEMQVTTLPLRTDRADMTRIVRFYSLANPLDPDSEHVAGIIETRAKVWFDIGAGTPDESPLFRKGPVEIHKPWGER